MLPPSLIALLSRVSRSFYFSVRVLPEAVAAQIGLSYLLARAADTIADTDLLPSSVRLDLLTELDLACSGDPSAAARLDRLLQAALSDGAVQSLPSSERTLLQVLDECLALLAQYSERDRVLMAKVLHQLITGMQVDLRRFPAAGSVTSADQVVSLRSLAELDEYTYYAAGCVGEFWTEICAAHIAGLSHLANPELLAKGVALGKALQLTNVVRDLASDLRIGRCYVPEPLVAEHGLSTDELFAQTMEPPSDWTKARALRHLTRDLLKLGLDRCDEAWPYVLAIPADQVRLRLACIWPLWLAVDTLALLGDVGSPLLTPDQPVKVTRQSLYALLAGTSTVTLFGRAVGSDRWLDSQFQQRRARALRSLEVRS